MFAWWRRAVLPSLLPSLSGCDRILPYSRCCLQLLDRLPDAYDEDGHDPLAPQSGAGTRQEEESPGFGCGLTSCRAQITVKVVISCWVSKISRQSPAVRKAEAPPAPLPCSRKSTTPKSERDVRVVISCWSSKISLSQPRALARNRTNSDSQTRNAGGPRERQQIPYRARQTPPTFLLRATSSAQPERVSRSVAARMQRAPLHHLRFIRLLLLVLLEAEAVGSFLFRGSLSEWWRASHKPTVPLKPPISTPFGRISAHVPAFAAAAAAAAASVQQPGWPHAGPRRRRLQHDELFGV